MSVKATIALATIASTVVFTGAHSVFERGRRFLEGNSLEIYSGPQHPDELFDL